MTQNIFSSRLRSTPRFHHARCLRAATCSDDATSTLFARFSRHTRSSQLKLEARSCLGPKREWVARAHEVKMPVFHASIEERQPITAAARCALRSSRFQAARRGAAELKPTYARDAHSSSALMTRASYRRRRNSTRHDMTS